MKIFSIRNYLLIGIVSLLFGTKAFASEQQVITSGDWKIVYNEGTKTCDFIHKEETILAGVFVQAKDKDLLLCSSEYAAPTFFEETVDDAFGVGGGVK